MNHRTLARLGAVPTAAGIAVLTFAGPASAHVTISPSTTAAGAYTVLTASLSHGCDGSATTQVAISIPEEILSVAPTRHPLWDVEVETEELAEPVSDAHGNEVTERDARVVYTTRAPLADGIREAFELSVKLPDAEGETLAFPTIQTCEQGETAWTEVVADGQDAEELDTPAPTLTITAAEGGSHGGAAADHGADQTGGEGGDTDADADEGNTMAALGLGAGVLGLLAGGTALVQSRRRD